MWYHQTKRGSGVVTGRCADRVPAPARANENLRKCCSVPAGRMVAIRANGEMTMKPICALALIVSLLLIGIAATACSNDVGANYYENETHGGYPGPGTRTPGRDG